MININKGDEVKEKIYHTVAKITEHSRKSIMSNNNFTEIIIRHAPFYSYKYQVYHLINGAVFKRHYRKSVSGAIKVQNRLIGKEE